MKAIIIEDEKVAAERLEKMLKEVAPNLNVIAKLGSIQDSVDWLKKNQCDIIFLDIQLSDGISFSIFEQVTVKTPIIFTTAYDQYAIKAFNLNSISYLLKPIRKNELEESLNKLESLKSAFSIDFESLLSGIQGKKLEFKKRFLIQIGDKLKKIETTDIAYFYAFDKSVFIKTFQNTSCAVDYTLDALENILDPNQYFRINRKYIVNIGAISEMLAYSRSRVKLNLKPPADDELDTIVSIDRSSEFKKWMNQ
ncbi:MAG TPA: DNA-binding response regulator [Bacteroidales bacterium]|jgi:DNA-binding LytR/AlgR family response regulator|nr:DNA-binding response regulator [Bacteroidales bacterium]